MRIFKPVSDPVIDVLDYAERIDGPDRGLINAWFVGRRMAARNPDLVARVLAGELPVLPAKGGVDKKVKTEKIGSLWYLAAWQGIRGEDLDIDMDAEVVMRCSRFGVSVRYTFDQVKLGKAQDGD